MGKQDGKKLPLKQFPLDRLAALSAAAVLLLAAMLYFFAFRPRLRYYVVYGAFDTEISLSSTTRTEKSFSAACAALEKRVRILNAEYDAFHSYEGINNVKTINDSAMSKSVTVSEDLYNMLAFARDAYYETYGAVDITLGPVTSVWRVSSQAGAVPGYEPLSVRGAFVGIDKLVLDEEKRSAYLTQYAAALDVGAVAKGYASRLLADELEGYLNNFILNAGGNIVCYGGSDYIVGITNPWAADGTGGEDEDGVYRAVSVRNKSVVTSGDYERFFIYEGKLYCHIIDPQTLYPPERYRSVTVIADDPAIADMLSTALFILDEDTGEQLLKRYNAGAVWIYHDKEFYCTDNVNLI